MPKQTIGKEQSGTTGQKSSSPVADTTEDARREKFLEAVARYLAALNGGR